MMHIARRRSRSQLGSWCAAATLLAASHASAQILHEIRRDAAGRLPIVQAISAEGNAVVGFAGFPGDRQAFIWSEGAGYTELRNMPTGTVRSDAMGVSQDGRIVVGNYYTATEQGIYRYDGHGITVIHGTPLTDRFLPNCLDAEGRRFAGSWSVGNSAEWGGCFLSDGDFAETFAPVGEVRGLSASGFTVIGARIPNGPGTSESFRWQLGTLTPLPMDGPTAVSGDGTVVVGSLREIFSPSSFVVRAIRWAAPGAPGGGGTTQVRIGGAITTAPLAISADGQTWGGFYVPLNDNQPTAWVSVNGAVFNLSDHLENRGVDVTGWTFQELGAISMDGTVFAGRGTHLGQTVAFVADTRKDTDGDGLYDDWEINGIPYMHNGIVGRYPLPDANPRRKDIYVEIDGIPGQVSSAAIDRVVQAFNNAPVPAVPEVPGALPGVSLHADIDEGDLQIDGNFTINRGWEEFHAVKDVYFGTYEERQAIAWPSMKQAKAKAFRYCLCVNDLPGALGRAELIDNGPTGAREGTNDFMLGLGGFTPPPGRSIEDVRAAAFMHELGHTLGLFHGGASASQNFNPNHYSIMNYLWAGVRRFGGVPSLLLNYSDAEPPVLVESALPEALGMQHPRAFTVPIVVRASITASDCGDPPTNHGSCFRTNEQNVLYTCINHVHSQGPVDWNNDRAITPANSSVCGDPNGLLARSPDEELASVNEWELLAYSFRNSAYFDDALMPATEHACPDAPMETFLTTLDPALPPCAGVPVVVGPTPAAVIGCTGQVVEFTADAQGDGPFVVRWRWLDTAAQPPAWRELDDGFLPGGTVIHGANTWTLAVENPVSASFGSSMVEFSCLVTDMCGASASSGTSVLSFGQLSASPSTPMQVVACRGGSATFAVSATSNNGPIAYQWTFPFDDGVLMDGPLAHGTIVSGSASATLTLQNIQPEDFGFDPTFPVQCRVSDGCGSVFPEQFTFSSTGVLISESPHDVQAGCSTSSNATFSVSALTAGAPGYQWRRNGVPLADGPRIAGAHTATITISPATAADGGIYTCEVSSSCSSELSQPARLNLGSPGISQDPPVFVPVCIGGNTDLGVEAYGSEPMTFRWMKNGVDLVDGPKYYGTASPNLAVFNIVPADLAAYSVRITNTCGTFVSQPRMLAQAQPLALDLQPQSQRACPGGHTSLSVSVLHEEPGVFFSWAIEDPLAPGQFIGLPGPLGGGADPNGTGACARVNGAQTATLTLDWNLGCSGTFRFVCGVFNGCESLNSSVATVTMCRADFNCANGLTVADIFDFLNAWFAGSPAADFNGHGLTVTDIFDFLSAWFSGC